MAKVDSISIDRASRKKSDRPFHNKKSDQPFHTTKSDQPFHEKRAITLDLEQEVKGDRILWRMRIATKSSNTANLSNTVHPLRVSNHT